MKLIHCSDVHLDSRMETHLTPEQARERRNELIMTFCAIIRYAVDNGVRAVIIAGDLFDTDCVRPATVSTVLDAMEQAPDVDFLYLRGNHDESRRAFAGRTLPPNLKTFSDSWTCYDYGRVTVAGVELNRENYEKIYLDLPLMLKPRRVNIVTMHGTISGKARPEEIYLSALRDKPIRYLALGHFHDFRKEPLNDNGGEYCYSGCPEGRGFDECGEKGFVLLDIDEKSLYMQTQFIPCARRRLYDIPVNISGMETVAQMNRAMLRACEGISPDSLVRFTLRGDSTLDTQKDTRMLLQMVQDQFYFVDIKDKSRLAVTPEMYRYDVSLKGIFIQMVLASKYPPEDQEKMIRWGIQALRGEDIDV